MPIKENIENVRRRIASACQRAKTDPGKIILLCVTKGRTIEQIREVVGLGLDKLGENRVQEAAQKYPLLPQAHWQMIGHLQTNKVKEAVNIFELIHSLDSVSLAREIDKQAARINKIQEVLLEVKTSAEAAKTGFSPQILEQSLEELEGFKNLKIKGLMTIAAGNSGSEGARPYFIQLRRLRDKLNPAWLLSMGMSDDFETAIEEGADIIRLGRVIFSPG